MNTYQNFIFENKLDLFLEEFENLAINLSESLENKPNVVEWDLTSKNGTFLDKLKDKITSFLSNIINKEQAINFFNKICDIISKLTNFKKPLVYFLLSCMLSFSFLTIAEISPHIKNREVKEVVNEIDSASIKEFKSLCDSLAFSESSGHWNIAKRTQAINNDGKLMFTYDKKHKKNVPVYKDYIGKYQLGKSALKEIGRTDITYEKFIKNPNIFTEKDQDEAIKKIFIKNKHYLRNWMKYLGKKYAGVEITLAGMLGAAHLVGNNGVKIFLQHHGKVDPVDGNGTPCSHYMKRFGKYKIII